MNGDREDRPVINTVLREGFVTMDGAIYLIVDFLNAGGSILCREDFIFDKSRFTRKNILMRDSFGRVQINGSWVWPIYKGEVREDIGNASRYDVDLEADEIVLLIKHTIAKHRTLVGENIHMGDRCLSGLSKPKKASIVLNENISKALNMLDNTVDIEDIDEIENKINSNIRHKHMMMSLHRR